MEIKNTQTALATEEAVVFQKRYTMEEDNLLIKLVNEGLEFAEIAERHIPGRTPRSLGMRHDVLVQHGICQPKPAAPLALVVKEAAPALPPVADLKKANILVPIAPVPMPLVLMAPPSEDNVFGGIKRNLEEVEVIRQKLKRKCIRAKEKLHVHEEMMKELKEVLKNAFDSL